MKRRASLASIILLVFVTSCALPKTPTAALPPPLEPTRIPTQLPTATPEPITELCPSIQKGVDFLMARYDAELGLLNESPVVAPNKYWLTNDNALAAYTFEVLGQPEMAARIRENLKPYSQNGYIEIIWGVPVRYPPYVPRQELLPYQGEKEIWQEFHDSDPVYEDWKKYADLGFMGALNEYNHGNSGEALTIYADTHAMYKESGLQDIVYNDPNANSKLYETYKLALALFVGKKIKAEIPNGDQMLEILQAMQSENGGFFTHYLDPQHPQGDQNTETTCHALLAEYYYGCTAQNTSK